MTVVANATPALRLFDEINDTLRDCGYDSKIYSLYQVRPPNGAWHLGITVVPRTGTGKHAKIELRIDDVSDDGVVSQPRLKNLTLYPIDSSAVRDNLYHDIESLIARRPYRLESRDLGHLIADALDSAGIAADK
ncbi:MAG: hypothetical protein DI609_12415 [Corynebacterium urealyticum]|uniref:Uncharacterized protein n=1 Tax=Corynebacterium urealyticum TaxID=43771 RepID=A0A2W5AT98_9CORY|nr:MAG: hypothetical protein DI609_12415 [Corynebacterium urealyticum]